MKIKYLYLILLCIISLNLFSEEKIEVKEEDVSNIIFEIDLSKQDIYNKCITWIASGFEDKEAKFAKYKTVVFDIELKDKEIGKIASKGNFEVPCGLGSYPCEFTMIIEIKDKKYRIQYNTIYIIIDKSSNESKRLESKRSVDSKSWRFLKPVIFEKFKRMNEDLFNFVKSKEEDW
jgi:hypothetical protein